MAHIRKAEVTSPITTLGGESTSRLLPVLGMVGLACIAGAFFLAGANMPRFTHAYLVNFCFFCTITLGCIFFVMIQHLTKAGWSVTVRRVAEIVGCGIFTMFLLFLPILITTFMGFDWLYPWTQAAADGGVPEWAFGDSRIYDIKRVFLNKNWFALRGIIYFAIWSFIAFRLYRWSIQQDETGDKNLSLKAQAFSAPMMLLFILSLAFASFDWEMSLAPIWFSTMFPVYFFAGCVLSSFAVIALICLLLQRSGRITDEVTVEHYHDLGKFMFAFIFFWGYIAFSQFMLIWYANFPEETFWFQFRSESGWLTVSMILLFGHLFIPFLAIMARTVRRSKPFLLVATIYLLIMHWVDHYWIVMPQLGAKFYNGELATTLGKGDLQLVTEAQINVFPGLTEMLLLVGMGAIFVASFCLISGNRSLVPLKDPRLHEALNYDNP